MRIKVVKGNESLKLCSYLLDPVKQIASKGNPVLDSNMSGRDAEELAEEFRFSQTLNTRVEAFMCHYCVSMPPSDRVESNNIAAISKALLQKMGHDKCQYFIVQHHDREHRNGVQHWHIATSAIALDGKWVDDGFNRLRLRTVEQQLEREFGLQQTVVRPVRDRRNLTTGEYRLKERKGTTLPKEKLWQKIQAAAADNPTFATFVERLQRDGATVQLRGLAQGSEVTGIGYGIDGSAFAGSKLGAAYSLRGIQEHLGVEYLPERDNPRLQELIERPLAVEVGQHSAELLDEVGQTIARIRQRRTAQDNRVEAQQPAQEAPALEEHTAKPKVHPHNDIDWEL